MLQQVVFVTSKISRNFKESCAMLTVVCLIVRQVALVFCDCQQKLLELHSPLFLWLVIYWGLSLYTCNQPCRTIYTTCRWTSSMVVPYQIFPLQSNHGFWFEVQEHILTVLHIRCHFLHVWCWSHWLQNLETLSARFPLFVMLPTSTHVVFILVLFSSWVILH